MWALNSPLLKEGIIKWLVLYFFCIRLGDLATTKAFQNHLVATMSFIFAWRFSSHQVVPTLDYERPFGGHQIILTLNYEGPPTGHYV